GAIFHYLGVGPNRTTEEDEEAAQKEMEASSKTQTSVNKEEQK
ncbi:formate dehydrogenase subunit beta, partial [Proteus mirabilis]|nr:formate dehydrogenase subunit beta [Proteus mirabilis]